MKPKVAYEIQNGLIYFRRTSFDRRKPDNRNSWSFPDPINEDYLNALLALRNLGRGESVKLTSVEASDLFQMCEAVEGLLSPGIPTEMAIKKLRMIRSVVSGK